MTEGREEGEDQLRFGALVICIDHGIIYYDNDISSIVSNDRIIEAWQQCKKCDGGKKKNGTRTSSGLGI